MGEISLREGDQERVIRETSLDKKLSRSREYDNDVSGEGGG